MSHKQVRSELAKGTPPDVICATCPWDRFCVSPPELTSEQVKARVEEGRQIDEELMSKRPLPPAERFPVAMMMSAMINAGRDQMGRLCPVFALRLQGPDGRNAADGIKKIMQGWGDGGA